MNHTPIIPRHVLHIRFFLMMSGNQQIENRFAIETEKGIGLDRYPVIQVKLTPSPLNSIQLMYPSSLNKFKIPNSSCKLMQDAFH